MVVARLRKKHWLVHTLLAVVLLAARASAQPVPATGADAELLEPGGGPALAPAPGFPQWNSERDEFVIEKGFAFIDGEYLEPPYRLATTDESVTINDHELKCHLPEFDSYGSRGFGPGRGNRWRLLGFNLRSQLSSNCVVLAFTDQPLIVFDGVGAYALMKTITGTGTEVHRAQLGERLPAGTDREVWDAWLAGFRANKNLQSRAGGMISTFDSAERNAAAAIAATRLLNNLAYPLTICGMVVSVLAMGHLLGGRPHARQSTRGIDDSPAMLSAFHWTLVLIALLSTLDIVWTLLAAQANQMRELNPLGRHLVDNPKHLIGYKIGATFPSLALLWLVRRYKRAQIAAWWICLILTLLAFRWLTFNSLWVAG